MIEIKNLTKRFPPDVVAVNQLTLDIKKGVNGLIGHNGAGKSTLLRLIADVYQKDEGIVLIDGIDNQDNDAKKNLFFLSDDPFYSGNGSAMENLALYDALFDLDQEKFKKMMSQLSLPLNRRVSTFSKGMRRQLFLCIALSMNAHYILLDEAFDGLDPMVIELVKDEIISTAQNKVFLISSHNLQTLERLCDNFILLSKGKLTKEGEREDMGKTFVKYQVMFPIEVNEQILKANGIDVISFKKSGSIYFIVLANPEQKDLLVEKFKPTLIENVAIENDEIIKLEMLIAKEGKKDE